MSSVLGICNLHDCPRLGRLTAKRSIGSVTFLGRYGLMDFTLSNFSNSGIDRVAILVDKYSNSIRTHVSSGKAWITNTRTGFQKVLYNEKQFSSPKFNTDINNILSNKLIVDDIDSDYVIIAAPFFLASMDFRPLLEKHIESGKEISLVYKHVDADRGEYENTDALTIENGLVKSGFIFDGKKEADISLEVFILNRKAFDEVVALSRTVSSIFGFRRMIRYIGENNIKEINAIQFDGDIVPILTFKSYVKYSFELLDHTKRRKLFVPGWPVYTISHNTPPALYGEEAEVKNSFIANGSKIYGTVKNSVLSRDVVVEKGAVVENCVLFTNTRIGAGVHVSNVVTDKQAKIVNSEVVKGEKDDMMFVDFGEII
ncbi:MAG: hypothetical protein MJZ37_03395 [Bacilli bacterium]|nr:hypothetical protein [Bacilli bacterium]